MAKYKSHESQLIHETWNTLENHLYYKVGLLDNHNKMKEYKKLYFKKINTTNILEWSQKSCAQLKIALDNNLI